MTDGSANDGGQGGYSGGSSGTQNAQDGEGAAGSAGAANDVSSSGGVGGAGNTGGGDGGSPPTISNMAGGGGGGSLETLGVGGGGGGSGFAAGSGSSSWGAGGGGGGGLAHRYASIANTNNGTILGGDGGQGSGGGGGGGGAGVLLAPTAVLTNSGHIAGGAGGAGGGGGGGGGAGVLAQQDSYLSNDGLVTGGAGGFGSGGADGGAGVAGSSFILVNGSFGHITGGAGGATGWYSTDGDGGAGVIAIGGTSLINIGTITGGDGGAGGLYSGRGGDGGAGVIATGDADIVNGGRVAGGAGGAGGSGSGIDGVLGRAIDFSGGSNMLTLKAGYSFVGNVTSTSGTTNGGDALVLGGNATGSEVFNTTAIVDAMPTSYSGLTQYFGFTTYEKKGSSTWSLVGQTAAVTPWTISDGTLQISSAASLGSPSGTITMNGGTLVTTADIVLSRAFSLTANGVFEVAAGTTLGLYGAVAGSNSLSKQGSGTLIMNGGNTYSGYTTVSAGTLIVGDTTHPGASIAGLVNVAPSATLGGFGHVHDAIINGTIAPGNSTGTLHVDNNLTINSSGVYEVEVDVAGNGDLIDVTGNAMLNGGTVSVLAANGNYQPQTTYTIVQTGGSVNGTFGTVTSNLAFLTPSLAYPGQAVLLKLTRNDIDFGSVALTYNQHSAATAASTLGMGSRVYDSLVGLSVPAARAAFDSLSGEIHASTMTALLSDSRHVRAAVDSRVQAHCTGTATNTRLKHCGPHFWAQTYGDWADYDGNGNAASLDVDSYGLLLGFDNAIAPNWRVGVVGGFGHVSADVDDRASSATADSVTLGLYSAGQWGALQLHLGAAYAWHDIDGERTVHVASLHGSPSADYDANTAQLFGELGYAFTFGQTTLTPFARAAYVHVDTDSFDEDGGAAALHSEGSNNSIGLSTLGVRLNQVLTATDTTTIRVYGELGWRHVYGDDTPEADLAFVSGGDDFTIKGAPLAEDAVAIKAGINAAISDSVTIGASYVGQFGDGVNHNGLRANLEWQF